MISIDLSGIDKAISQIEDYGRKIGRLETELPVRLAEIGKPIASIGFASAPYNENHHIAHYPRSAVVDIRRAEDNTVLLSATGKDVAFIEFGAGVYYNGEGDYPIPKPPGIVGIGEYGMGQGKRNFWKFPAIDGNMYWTTGTPASYPMYFALKEMQSKVVRVAEQMITEGER